MSATSFELHDLLPPAYSNQHRLQRAFYGWLTVLVAGLMVLIAVTIATLVNQKKTQQLNRQIVATAVPLWQLEQEVQGLRADNSRREQWCRDVETSRPDDSMLQAIGSIALTSDSMNGPVAIDALKVRLPLEFAANVSETPEWAVPELQLIGRRTDVGVDVQRWAEMLNATDRIEDAEIEIDDGRVTVTATPIATRVLP